MTAPLNTAREALIADLRAMAAQNGTAWAYAKLATDAADALSSSPSVPDTVNAGMVEALRKAEGFLRAHYPPSHAIVSLDRAAIAAAEAPPPASPIQAHGVRWTEEVREWIARLKRDHDAVLARLGDSGGTSTPEDMAAGRVAAYQRGFQVGARHTAETLEIWLGRLATPAQTSTASEQAGEAVRKALRRIGDWINQLPIPTHGATAMLFVVEDALAALSRGDADHSPDVGKMVPDAGAPSREADDPINPTRIAEVMAEGDGFWRTCSGCHESEDGYDVGFYPHNDAFGCKLGGGCGECGGLGAIWDTTDYEAMGRELSTPPALKASELGEKLQAVIAKYEGDELHDEGAFDVECETCRILNDLRALLSAVPLSTISEGWRPQHPIICYRAEKDDVGAFIVSLVLTQADDAREFVRWAMELPAMCDTAPPAPTQDAEGEG